VTFEGRRDRTADLCGEKLGEAQVLAALDRLELPTRFAVVAPVRAAVPYYALLVETDAPQGALDAAARAVESAFADGYHYRYCRDLGQLGAVRAVRLRDGWGAYEQVAVARGQRLGDLTPQRFDPRPGWEVALDRDPHAPSR
jgi:hypothetical protein